MRGPDLLWVENYTNYYTKLRTQPDRRLVIDHLYFFWLFFSFLCFAFTHRRAVSALRRAVHLVQIVCSLGLGTRTKFAKELDRGNPSPGSELSLELARRRAFNAPRWENHCTRVARGLDPAANNAFTKGPEARNASSSPNTSTVVPHCGHALRCRECRPAHDNNLHERTGAILATLTTTELFTRLVVTPLFVSTPTRPGSLGAAICYSFHGGAH